MTKQQIQDKPQSSEDVLREFQRELRKQFPPERVIQELRYLAASNDKRIRREALALLKQMEQWQKAEADENAKAKAELTDGRSSEAEAHAEKPSQLARRVPVDKGVC